MAKMIAAMSAKKNPPKLVINVDDDQDEKEFKSHIARFVGNLIAATPQHSKLAYTICHFLEKDGLEIPELNKIFPGEQVRLSKVSKKKTEQTAELDQEIADLKSEIADMKKTKKLLVANKSGKRDLKAISDEIGNYEDELSDRILSREELTKKDSSKMTYPLGADSSQHKVDDKDWAILKKWFGKQSEKSLVTNKDSIFSNLDLLCKHLDFSEHERTFLRLLICADEDSDFSNFVESLAKGKQKTAYDIMAKMVDVSRPEIVAMMQPHSQLVEKGMIVPSSLLDDDDMDDDSPIPFLPSYVMNVLREPDLNIDTISRRLVGEPATTELDWDRDFSHLGERGQQMIAMLQAAKEGKIKGINILLYGLPDTGKTEAVKAAAKKVGLSLYMVGEKSNYGGEPDRADRIQSALLAQALLADKKDAAVLFDEMEDLLPSAGGGLFEAPRSDKPTGASKVFLNRLLESNKTITFWTANDPDKFHSAVRRRMRYSIEFDVPPVSVRERLWGSISSRHQFNLSAADCRQLAQRFIAPPGMIDTAIRNAVLAGGVSSIPLSLAASAKLVFGSRDVIIVRDTVPSNYDPRLLVAKLEDSDLNLDELQTHIKASGNTAYSMLLYGDPGTGKSVFAAYLAQQMGMETMLVKASDILDKYVGGNEQNIAKIFKDARENKKFLIIDEGDTFVRRRDQASQNWEVSTVNEMLVQIENHTGPVAMTTNLFADIDPAVKRRFLFKIKCSHMSPEQTRMAFEEVFFKRPAPDSLLTGPKLTPADFALVKKQMTVMSPDITTERIVQLLAIEARTRIEKASGYDGKEGFGFGAAKSTVTQMRPA